MTTGIIGDNEGNLVGNSGFVLSQIRQPKSSWPSERRKEPRWQLPDPLLTVRATMLPDTDLIDAQLCNISKTGVGLTARNFIPPGAYVVFELGRQEVYGQVRHCRAGRSGFALGVHIKAVIDLACQSESDLAGSGGQGM